MKKKTKNPDDKAGKCLNVGPGNCSKANSGEIIYIDKYSDFVCPECETELEEIKESSSFPWWLIIVAVIVVSGGIAAFFLLGNGGKSTETDVKDEGTEKIEKIEKTLTEITAVTLSETEIELKVKEKAMIAITTEELKDAELIWTSKNTGIATVSDKGEITGVSKGETVVTVNYKDLSASVKVVVKAAETTGEKKVIPSGGGGSRSGTLKFPYGTYAGDIKNGKADGQGRLTYSQRTLISADDPKQRYAEPGEWVEGTWYDNKLDFGKLFGTNGAQKESLMIGRR